MAVTSKDLDKRQPAAQPAAEEQTYVEERGFSIPALSTSKVAAACLWAIAVLCTREAVGYFISGMLSIVLATGFQMALTKLESPIWRPRWIHDEDADIWYRKRPGILNWAALLVDDILNISGVWLVVRDAHDLPPARAFAEMMERDALNPIRGWPAAVICAAAGLILCGGPELLFYSDDD